jgi:hypothetical protein
VADFNYSRPSTVGRTPRFQYKGKSGILCLFDSNGTGVRLAEPEACFMAKAGNTWTDVYYPAVDMTPFFQASGFPLDVFQWSLSGWAVVSGRNKVGIDFFERLMADYRREAAKYGEGLKAIVIIGLTNDVLYCRYGKGRGKYPESVDALIVQRDTWAKQLAARMGVPVIIVGTGTTKGRYDAVVVDVPLGYIGDKPDREIRQIVSDAHARIYNRLGEATVTGPWPGMAPTVYHLQKPHLSPRETDWMGHPGKNEAFLQGVLLHNALAWICVKAGWFPTLQGMELVPGYIFGCFLLVWIIHRGFLCFQ